jgi:hypothetical protein
MDKIKKCLQCEEQLTQKMGESDVAFAKRKFCNMECAELYMDNYGDF